MRIGILNADELSSDIIQTYGDYGNMLVNLFDKIDTDFVFSTYPICTDHYPRTINECDAYIITGSKVSVYAPHAWISHLKKFILELYEQRKKLVGICFGHQLIAETLGGRVEKNKKGWGVGLMSSEILCHPEWLKPERDHFSLPVSHQDQVTELPEQATCLASSPFCHYSSFYINSSILTFQGHPEFTKDYLLNRMKGRRRLIGEPVYQQAVTSLAQPGDEQLIATWISEFMTSVDSD